MHDSRLTVRSLTKWVGFSCLVAVCAVHTVSVTAADKRGRSPKKIAARIDGAAVPKGHELSKPLRIARDSRAALRKIDDYSATLRKRERFGKKLQSVEMSMKFRREPFSVYFRYRKPNAGREVIFVEGKNRGNLLVHESGLKSLVGTLTFSPTADRVMKDNRHPITQAGLEKMLDALIAQWESETRYGEIKVRYFNQAKIGNVDCMAVETMHPKPRKQFQFHMTRLYINKATKLPLRIEQYGWPRKAGDKPPIMEEYTYSNVKTNVGLKNIDFSRNNPKYGF